MLSYAQHNWVLLCVISLNFNYLFTIYALLKLRVEFFLFWRFFSYALSRHKQAILGSVFTGLLNTDYAELVSC
ncbi:hypothetical protein FXF05_10080 [Vibrio mimicus]|nr:hypothetical protein FXF05_10080 [Vibrio mimicus]